jgi:hypothetical protein
MKTCASVLLSKRGFYKPERAYENFIRRSSYARSAACSGQCCTQIPLAICFTHRAGSLRLPASPRRASLLVWRRSGIGPATRHVLDVKAGRAGVFLQGQWVVHDSFLSATSLRFIESQGRPSRRPPCKTRLNTPPSRYWPTRYGKNGAGLTVLPRPAGGKPSSCGVTRRSRPQGLRMRLQRPRSLPAIRPHPIFRM